MDRIKIWSPSIGAGLVLGLNYLLNLPNLPNFIGISLIYWLIFILLIIQIIVLQIKISNLVNSRPNIEPYEIPFMDIRPLIQSDFNKSEIVSSLIFFHMKFANNPKMRIEQSTARKVFAQLSFYDKNRRRLVGPIFGRWGDTVQPGMRSAFSPNRDLLSVDLESSGLPRELNLALKYPEEEDIYAFNNDSYGYKGWKNPSYRLTEKEIYIHIRLSGENAANSELWILLENKGNVLTMRPTQALDLPSDQDKTLWMQMTKTSKRN